MPLRRPAIGHSPVLARLIVILATGFFCAAATRPAPQDRPQQSPLAALNEAIKMLTREAEEARQNEELARQSADFARSFRKTVDQVQLSKKLVQPFSRDSFVDAYVRWQLTGFRPSLPEMTDREFEKFLSNLPDLLDNPHADQSLITSFNRLQQRQQEREGGQLTEQEVERVNDQLSRLATRAGSANNLNRPALQFRRWVERTVGDSGVRPHQQRLEHCAALVAAGWDVERIKRQISQGLGAAKRDVEFTNEQRQRVAEQARRLIGRRRALLQSARVIDSRLEMNISETAVYDFEVSRWERSLARK